MQEPTNPFSIPPPSDDETVRFWWIVGQVLAAVVMFGTPAAIAFWQWWTKRQEKRDAEAAAAAAALREDQARRDAEAAQREADRLKSEREMIARQYESQAKQQSEFYGVLLTEVQDLRRGDAERRKEVAELQSKVQNLQERLKFYEENPAATETRELLAGVFEGVLPDEAWLRDVANNKWFFTKGYCKRFSIERRGDFWNPVNIMAFYDADDSVRYASQDLAVIEAGVPTEFVEPVRKRIMDPRCNEFYLARIRKTPILVDDKHHFVVGVVLAILEEDHVPKVAG